MERFGYGLAELIADLRVIIADAADAQEILEQARPLVEWVSQEPERLLAVRRFETDSQKGFGTAMLYEEPGNALTICAIVWPPGGFVMPHDHHSWEILSPVYGTVRHSTWTRMDVAPCSDDARVEKGCEFLLHAGQAAAMMPQEIHALENIGPSPSLTMHIYGCALAEVERNRFDTSKSRQMSVSIR